MNTTLLQRLLEETDIPVTDTPFQLPGSARSPGLGVILEPDRERAHLAIRLSPAGRPLARREQRAIAIFALAGGRDPMLATEIGEIAQARLATSIAASVDSRGMSWRLK